MGLKVDTVETSVVPGLYEVQFTSGPVVYATASGDYMILGDLFSVGEDGYTNLTEKRRDGQRLEKLAQVDEKDMIIFSPEGEPRARMTVFTDVSCFYCQKLHKGSAGTQQARSGGALSRLSAFRHGFRRLHRSW